MLEHEHPLLLVDMLSKHINYEEESDEDGDENDYLVTKQNFNCECHRCRKQINWFHRFYYKCDQCQYSIHKFCQELPATLEHPSHVAHTLDLIQTYHFWFCRLCDNEYDTRDILYNCSRCGVCICVRCATKWLKTNIIYHPFHIHPLLSIGYDLQILCKCDACGKEHKGVFYQCINGCPSPLIHNDCAFLPQKLLIQQTTDDSFSHSHPLILSYFFSNEDWLWAHIPKCRVCNGEFDFTTLWNYKCDKCRFYAHLDCATYRDEPFMSILSAPGTGKLIKNYKDDEYPNLLHLPFPDESYSLLQHLFYKETESMMSLETTQVIQKQAHVSHPHPLILVDVTGPNVSLKAKKVSYHNPMERIRVLCEGCLRPIIKPPFYMCDDENCNYVLHEWCTRLPAKIDHPGHPEHPLVYYPKIPYTFLTCSACNLRCNGFVYSCVECKYDVDVCCAFIPEKVVHEAHQNHLLSRVKNRPKDNYNFCRLCGGFIHQQFSFSCKDCNFHIHLECGLLLSETIRHKHDKHPMKLSYFPIENHKSDYFCEICEKKLYPNRSFYHCHECVQSVHSWCAPLILQSETIDDIYLHTGTYPFINLKFGGNYDGVYRNPHASRSFD